MSARTSHRPALRAQRGFSLVELMVGMLLSLVLLAGALSILYSSKITYSENDRISRLQETGRTVVEMILRDARATGFRGCGRPKDPTYFSNGLVDANQLLWNMGQPIYGFDYDSSGGTWKPVLDAVTIPGASPDSDIIVLRTTRDGTPSFRLSAPVTTASDDLQVFRGSGITVPVGQTMIANDCVNTTVFAVSAFVPGGATAATLQHRAGGAPGTNASNNLLSGLTADAQVSFVDTVIYYVRDDGTGAALWRRIGNEPQPQRLIPGVENLQILYGVDTNADLLVDEYRRADEIDAANNWANVISLTIAVLVRTEDENNLERDTRTYNMLTHNVGPFNDRRQRSMFVTTVTLRNQTT